MEKHALVLALALTVPLVLYGIPLAYAATTSSYVVATPATLDLGSPTSPTTFDAVMNCNSNDYATGGGYTMGNNPPLELFSRPIAGGAPITTTGVTPNGWEVFFANTNGIRYTGFGYAICQSPITVAGVGVPEFGQLYIAIALGALVYFIMAKRFASTPKIIATPS